jgi:hypothetical protein
LKFCLLIKVSNGWVEDEGDIRVALVIAGNCCLSVLMRVSYWKQQVSEVSTKGTFAVAKLDMIVVMIEGKKIECETRRWLR